MNAITPFHFGDQQVRVISDDHGEPWFVGADVCEALALRNSRDAMARLDEDEKGVAITDTLGGQQEMVTINESGLYSLILTSRKAEARKFKKWVTSEVLPAIRRTGAYAAAPAMPVVKNAAMQLVIAQAMELDRLEQEQRMLASRVEAVESRVSTQDSMFYTVIGYAKRCGAFVDNARASVLGRLATRLSRERDYPMGKASDPRFGVVHTYHTDILQEVFG
ncbi:MAG: putative phage-encoded protein [Candidatus Accumulibacter sp. BA-94]|uniref:BRO-N domain-containing protein n=1 Tax=Accumulibacter sp. TaxID=2053492 RepID=UPI0004499E1E|nr:Bro-N domain-containing protein [Accumulibacter sp.]EXI92404.1 MAG: putative phage-encoded protein [Candidatus Accumulibacter sp. BA-94]HRD88224.1 Bro-N domain-containing protein [Accumulibacter sp.]